MMFRVENNVPDVYVNESRDFQLFSKLYDLVFQASRFSIDSMEQISDTMHCNDNLLSLIATKVGFFTDLRLTSKADRLILSAFPHIMKYKGSSKSIHLVANLFGRIVNTNVFVEFDRNDNNKVTILFEKYTSNIELLRELLEYIRPTGLLIEFHVLYGIDESSDYVSNDVVKIRTMHDKVDEISELSYVEQIQPTSSEISDVISNIGFTLIANSEQEKQEENL